MIEVLLLFVAEHDQLKKPRWLGIPINPTGWKLLAQTPQFSESFVKRENNEPSIRLLSSINIYLKVAKMFIVAPLARPHVIFFQQIQTNLAPEYIIRSRKEVNLLVACVKVGWEV